MAANQGMVLLIAYLATKNPEYLQAATASLDYLLGRNATRYSFVTGIGKNVPMNIHHRQSEADGIKEPVPGFLVGGPNPGQQDNCSYPSALPAKSYTDSWCSYASNEVTINWNAPLVFLAAGLESVYEQNSYEALNQVPGRPESLQAEVLQDSGFGLKWKLLSSDLMRYIVERSEGDAENFEVIAEAVGTVLSYQDVESKLKSKTPYYYRIKSVNMFGESAWSDTAFALMGGENPSGLFQNQAYSQNFRVFPNPSKGRLYLAIPPHEVGASLKVRIMNLQGQTLVEYLLKGTDEGYSFEVEQLKGYFIIQLEGKETLYRPQRVMLQ